MQLTKFLFLAIALIALSCKSKKEVSEGTASQAEATLDSNQPVSSNVKSEGFFSADELADTAVIVRLNTTACYGVCPIFDFELRKNGKASFFGRGFVEYKGKHSMQLKPSEYLEVFQKAEEAGFYDLDKVYDALVTDMPSSTIYLNNGMDSHQTMLRFDIPENAQAFNKWLTEWVLALDWAQNAKEEAEDK